MFEKILIANRGEIAVRIIRACREMGIKTAAVYSEADAASMHVRLADESVCIGPAAAAESYLHVPNIIAAARNVGAEAIHPGAGFLAESAMFAEVCREYEIANIGPTPEQLAAAGNKSAAIEAARDAGLPILESSSEPLRDLRTARDALAELGTPAMLKAAAGGGGRGMRQIRNFSQLMTAFPQAQSEAA
ncbi:MAG: acetyl-CoA carboxylase biotin carboxylase subunit, partial [Chloroflexota bacterium]|nr:acetyl-CoA carboxylase biotin carboxylase subunit [Chloroflexota bacterium]